MLAALLPGIRHVRTPFITGALYLFAIWLVFGPTDFFTSAGESVPAERAATFLDTFGPGAIPAAVSLAALLLGSLLVIPSGLDTGGREATPWSDLTNWLVDLFGSEANFPTYAQIEADPSLSQTFKDAMKSEWNSAHPVNYDLQGEEFESAVAEQDRARGVVRPETYYLVTSTRIEIYKEYDLLASRLQVEHESVYTEVDRLRAEAELRYSIALPLALIACAVGALWEWWALSLVILPAALVLQARRTERLARDKVFTALQHGLVASPTVEALRRLSRTG